MEGLRSPVRMVLEGAEGFVLLALALLSWPLTRFLMQQWGSRRAELARAWPGDDLLPSVDACNTRAVTVQASAADVWPWLLQFGLGRGGFHSYELLERIGGLDVRNLERILPQLQNVCIGDALKVHPTEPPLLVAILDERASLCTRTWKDDADIVARDPSMIGTFSLLLVAEDPQRCRLLVRTCKHHRKPRSIGRRAFETFFEDPLDLVMEQRMLRTIRRLAERARS